MTVISLSTAPPAPFTALCRAEGAFARASSRANIASVVSGGICAMARRDGLLDVRLAPALDPVDDDHALPIASVIAASARATAAGEPALALEKLDADATAAALDERAQTGPALGHSAVIVAVDQVRGSEFSHRARVYARARR